MNTLFFKLLFIICLNFKLIFAQTQLDIAPEVWSVPKKVEIISEWSPRGEHPSISFDKQKLYYHAGGPAVSEWSDSGWTEPYSLNSNINKNLARWPSISPNGKRIFFSWYTGGWDLYYSDWDSAANDWGPAVNCGPNVNTPEEAEFAGCLPNDTTLIFLRTTDAHISHWDSQNQVWGFSERWPITDLWYTSDLGIYVSPDFSKVYDTGARGDTTINGQPYLNYDIEVSYKDTSSTNPRGYTRPYIINFCFHADTQYFAGNYKDRFEGYPSLTPEGKKMYFTANYDSQTTIWESDMLIDENGNPVSIIEDNNDSLIPHGIELQPAYPNPFNSATKIQYKISNPGTINISLYDLLGQKLTELYDGIKAAGQYEITINAENLKLSSGTYIILLKDEDQKVSQKIIYLK